MKTIQVILTICLALVPFVCEAQHFESVYSEATDIVDMKTGKKIPFDGSSFHVAFYDNYIVINGTKQIPFHHSTETEKIYRETASTLMSIDYHVNANYKMAQVVYSNLVSKKQYFIDMSIGNVPQPSSAEGIGRETAQRNMYE